MQLQHGMAWPRIVHHCSEFYCASDNSIAGIRIRLTAAAPYVLSGIVSVWRILVQVLGSVDKCGWYAKIDRLQLRPDKRISGPILCNVVIQTLNVGQQQRSTFHYTTMDDRIDNENGSGDQNLFRFLDALAPSWEALRKRSLVNFMMNLLIKISLTFDFFPCYQAHPHPSCARSLGRPAESVCSPLYRQSFFPSASRKLPSDWLAVFAHVLVGSASQPQCLR